MNSKSAYDSVPYQKIMSTLLGSLSPHLDHSQSHPNCVQVITSIVIDMVAESIGLMMGNPLAGMMMAAAADAAMQEVAVQIGLLNQFSWVNVIEAGFDVGAKYVMRALGSLDLLDETIANASIASAKTISRQLTEMALGQRKQLDLKQVLAAIEMTVIDSTIQLPQPSNAFLGKIENLFRAGAEQIIGDVIIGTPVDIKTIGANMIGDEIGSDLSGLIQQTAKSPAKTTVLQAQNQTGINDKSNPKTGPQAQLHADYIKSVARGQGISETHDNTYTYGLNVNAGSELNDEWDLHKSVRSASNKPAMSTNQNNPSRRQNLAKTQKVSGNKATLFKSKISIGSSNSAPLEKYNNAVNKLNGVEVGKKYVVYADSVYSDHAVPKGAILLNDHPEMLKALGLSKAFFDDKYAHFHAALYKRGNEYILAFRGTTSLRDVSTDINQNQGNITLGYIDAMVVAGKVSFAVGANNLTLVGHSLGGGEAAAASLLTQSRAITFNAAGLNPNTIAAGYTGVSLKDAPHYITNYYVKGELLKELPSSTFSRRIDRIWPAVGRQVEIPAINQRTTRNVGNIKSEIKSLLSSPASFSMFTSKRVSNELELHKLASVEASLNYEESNISRQLSHMKSIR